MNATGREILANPAPQAHIVYPYTDDAQLAEAVCLFAASGLRKVEAVLLVLADQHHDPIRRCLERQGFNLEELENTGHLIFQNAASLLRSFMPDGAIDERKFKTVLGSLIEKAKGGNGTRKDRPVRVFGEIVDLAWKLHPKATEQMEQLWNEVIGIHSVPLLCAYWLSSMPEKLPSGIELCHSHAI